jgi:tetratricopeptide (TPR) repeat protein
MRTRPFLIHHSPFAILLFLFTLLLATGLGAQEWRGMGRVGGKVVDEGGKPIDGVQVKAMLASAGNQGPSSKSNAKGDWAIGGIARGNWALDFSKEGFETRRISISVSEVSRIPPMEIVLKRVVPVVDPNAEIKDKLTEAAALMNAKKFADARAIYEDLAAKYPSVKEFRPLIARAHYGEGNKERAIEELRKAAEQDPENIEVRLLLGNTLMETGKQEEGRQVLAAVDDSKVKDPIVYINIGIALMNQNKQAEAITWFDKAIQRFPDQPDAYYYRGVSKLGLGDQAGAKADIQKFLALAPADAPERALATKILESIK